MAKETGLQTREQEEEKRKNMPKHNKSGRFFPHESDSCFFFSCCLNLVGPSLWGTCVVSLSFKCAGEICLRRWLLIRAGLAGASRFRSLFGWGLGGILPSFLSFRLYPTRDTGAFARSCLPPPPRRRYLLLYIQSPRPASYLHKARSLGFMRIAVGVGVCGCFCTKKRTIPRLETHGGRLSPPTRCYRANLLPSLPPLRHAFCDCLSSVLVVVIPSVQNRGTARAPPSLPSCTKYCSSIISYPPLPQTLHPPRQGPLHEGVPVLSYAPFSLSLSLSRALRFRRLPLRA